MSRLLMGVLFLALVISWGCSVARRTGPREAQPNLQRVVQRLRCQDRDLASLRAWAAIRWSRGGRGGGGDHALIVKRPDRLRLDGLAPLGSIVYSLVIRDSQVTLFIPSEQRVYRGPATPGFLSRFFSMPLRVAELIDVLCGRIVPPAGRTARIQRDGDHLVLDDGRRNGGWRRRILLDPFSLDPMKMMLRDEADRIFLVVTWAGYRSSAGTRFPTKVRVDTPLEDGRLSVRLEDVEVDPPVGDKQFHIDVPDGVETLPLSALTGQ